MGFLLARLQSAVYDAGDVIYSAGDPAAEMFLVVSGRVALRADGAPPPPHRAAAAAAAAAPPSDSPVPGARRGGAAGAPPSVAERGDAFGELCLFPEEHGGARRESAVAETWVEAYCLRADRLPEIGAAHPELVARLRSFCAARALVLDAADAAAAGRNAAGGGGGRTVAQGAHSLGSQPCRLRQAAETILRGLVARAEETRLLPEAGPGCSAVFHLMARLPPPAAAHSTTMHCSSGGVGGGRVGKGNCAGLGWNQPPPPDSTLQWKSWSMSTPDGSWKQDVGLPAAAGHFTFGGSSASHVPLGDHGLEPGQPTWQGVSCALSARGELLCLPHGDPHGPVRSLGFVRPGLSTYRALGAREVALRKGTLPGGGPLLLGCSVLVFPSRSEACAREAGESVIFLTRKAEDRDAFGIAVVRHLLAPPDPALDDSAAAVCDIAVVTAAAVDDKAGSFRTKSAGQNGWTGSSCGGPGDREAAESAAAASDCGRGGAALEELVTTLFNQLQGRLDLHVASIDCRIEKLLAVISPPSQGMHVCPREKGQGTLPQPPPQCDSSNGESNEKDLHVIGTDGGVPSLHAALADAGTQAEGSLDSAEEPKMTIVTMSDRLNTPSLIEKVSWPSARAYCEVQQQSHAQAQNGFESRQLDEMDTSETPLKVLKYFCHSQFLHFALWNCSTLLCLSLLSQFILSFNPVYLLSCILSHTLLGWNGFIALVPSRSSTSLFLAANPDYLIFN